MKKINFKVEKTSDGYTALYQAADGGIIFTDGDTLTSLKANALDALNLTLEHQKKKQADENSISLQIDLPSFFDYYKVINTSQLASRLKINRSLLTQYINGVKKPSQTQTQRILQGVNSLGRELSAIDFS